MSENSAKCTGAELKKVAPITTELNVNASLSNEVREVLTKLHERLMPVLQQSAPSSGEACMPENPTNSGVLGDIRIANDNLREFRERLNDLLDRLLI